MSTIPIGGTTVHDQRLIERVARALAISRGLDPDGISPEPAAPTIWECHAHHARFAIEAVSAFKVEEAAGWLASLPRSERPSPIIPALRERFGLADDEAAEAVRHAILEEGRAA